MATDFNTPNGGGLWDATHLTVRQSAWNAQFILTMSEMTDIWGLANGFSHQIVQIYVDQGETSYGRTSMLTGANAEYKQMGLDVHAPLNHRDGTV